MRYRFEPISLPHQTTMLRPLNARARRPYIGKEKQKVEKSFF